jgi:GNAT superfamily N-acetyltransferase
MDAPVAVDVAPMLERVRFAREAIATVFEDIQPLLLAHWREIAHFKDIPLAPDFSRYRRAEEHGVLRIFTARAERLVGYAIYAVETALHYSGSLQASQDTLYLDPRYRLGRTGLKLIEFADESLRAEGVQVVHQHATVAHDFGPVLEHLGYELVECRYARRLR